MLNCGRIDRLSDRVPEKSTEITPSEIAAKMAAPIERARGLRTDFFMMQRFGLFFFSTIDVP